MPLARGTASPMVARMSSGGTRCPKNRMASAPFSQRKTPSSRSFSEVSPAHSTGTACHITIDRKPLSNQMTQDSAQGPENHPPHKGQPGTIQGRWTAKPWNAISVPIRHLLPRSVQSERTGCHAFKYGIRSVGCLIVAQQRTLHLLEFPWGLLDEGHTCLTYVRPLADGCSSSGFF